ncbi:MAG: thymidine phosphorylase [Myxococcota bacterium]
MTAARTIARKRDGAALSDREIRDLVEGFVRGEVADYQMTAWAMAVVLRGMNERETTALTLAMRDSGRMLRFSKRARPLVDKHSTGGVGDKVSLCLAPLVAACGVRVPMISGRGLSHTGGTLDKLEAIPGFRVDLEPESFVRQVQDLGCALAGQTEELAPADRRLYALRDVTATVESVPLITASILSKKLAEGIDALVLDVKVGRGAFMKTPEDARQLARSLVRVGKRAGIRVSAILTDMDVPLGRAVGNALETAEAMRVLHGEGPEDLRELTLALGAEMLRLGGVVRGAAAGRRRLARALEDGSAREVMRKVVAAQGGDARVVDEPDRLPSAPLVRPVPSPKRGYVQDVDPLQVGLVSMDLGAGRQRADQAVDPTVGVVLDRKPGERIERGDPLAHVHAADHRAAAQAAQRVADAFRIGRSRVNARDLILARLR